MHRARWRAGLECIDDNDRLAATEMPQKRQALCTAVQKLYFAAPASSG